MNVCVTVCDYESKNVSMCALKYVTMRAQII